MEFALFNQNPHPHLQATLISGPASEGYKQQVFLVCSEHEIPVNIYEIRYEVSCSPFSYHDMYEGVLAVGFEDTFYMYNTLENKVLAIVKMDGYFCSAQFTDHHFYVTDASGIICIEKSGKIVWDNHDLGMDGVLINDIEGGHIMGSGEWDPPGGWKKFELDIKTGQKIN